MKKNDIKIETENQTNSAKIFLSGSFTISNIENILPEINSVIDKFSKISITGQNIEEIDLAAIQVFYSIAKTLKKDKKEIKINFNFNEQTEQTVINNGFANFFNI